MNMCVFLGLDIHSLVGIKCKLYIVEVSLSFFVFNLK